MNAYRLLVGKAERKKETTIKAVVNGWLMLRGVM
jgi:hypothetical protein